jgi:hypothetical protein
MKMKSVKIFGKSVPILLIALATIAVVSATGIWIYSNTVTVTVGPPPAPTYSLQFNAPNYITIGSPINFNGQLKLGNNGVNGATIYIYDTSSGTPVQIATATTDSSGNFNTNGYTPQSQGTFTYQAGFQTP